MTVRNSTVRASLRGGYARGAPYAGAFARYLRAALDAYAAAGAPLFGLTAGNEPNHLGQSWQQLVMSAAEQREWIAHHLGPALKPALARTLGNALPSAPAVAVVRGGAAEYELLMLDDQRPFIASWMRAVLLAVDDDARAPASAPARRRVAAVAAADAAPYVDGVGFHWYLALEDSLIVHPGKMLAAAHARFPEKFLLATEACEGYMPAHKGVELGSWWRALKYGYDIVEDTANWAVGWTDWNLVLDMRGGPNWRGNLVDAPVVWDNASGTFFKQPLFYAVGHFSKFVPPGSVALELESKGRLELPAVAFARPDGVVAVVVVNQRSLRRRYALRSPDGRYVNAHIPPHALHTVLFRPLDGACASV